MGSSYTRSSLPMANTMPFCLLSSTTADAVYNIIVSSLQDISHKVIFYVREVDVINDKLPVQRVSYEKWRPPEEPFFKVNFDAAFQSHSKRFCLGIIVRDAARLRLHLGLKEMVLKGDALSVVRKLKSNNLDASEGLKRGDNTNLGEGMSEYLVDELENDRQVGHAITGEPILGLSMVTGVS
ncbi:hypothetical protein Gotur_023253 [Gossypium turneri]